MSGKSRFKFNLGKKEQGQAKQAEPRSVEELQKLYSDLRVRLGDAQYLVHLYEQEVANLSKGMQDVSQEAAKRQELDRQATAATAKPEEAANVQS